MWQPHSFPAAATAGEMRYYMTLFQLLKQGSGFLIGSQAQNHDAVRSNGTPLIMAPRVVTYLQHLCSDIDKL